MNSWYKLGDFVSKSIKGITPRYVEESDVIVLNQKCIRNNTIDYSYARFHDPSRNFTDNKILKVGDLLFNSTGQGTAGRCCFVRELPKNKKVITDSHILIIRINDFYLAESFSYALFKEEALIQTFMDGSTGQGELDKLRLYNIEFQLPNKLDRQRICEFLRRLNQKIELNNEINAELEVIAKLIYNYWFVQFDFPISLDYAKAIGKPELAGKPYKASGGGMVYNEKLKWEIPTGWKDGMFDDVAQIIGGSTPSRAEASNFIVGKGTPWITPKDLSLNKGKKFISRGEIDVTEKGIKNASLKLLPEGSVLLSSRAPIGYLAIARQPVTTNQGFKSFTPKKYFTSEFLFYQIKNNIPLIEARSGGSTFKEVSGSVLKGLKVVLPPKGIIDSYQDIIKPIFKKQNIVELENKELKELRDWLLPMLMNGQVTIKKTYNKVDDQLEMAAEEETAYQRNSEFVDSLFEQVNLYKEIAAIQLLEEETIGITHGKTGIQKTTSNLQQIFKEKRLKNVKFEERPWGMYSETIAENIETNPFLLNQELESGKKVYRVKPEARKEVQSWIKLEENQQYIQSLKQLLSIYQEPFIKNDIYKIELLNTVYRCMIKLHTDNLYTIRTAMQNWPMIEKKYKNKAEKFSERVTAKMIDFIKDKQLI